MDSRPTPSQLRYFRVLDGIISVIIGGICLSATFSNWLLPCIPVTRLIPSARGGISNEVKSFCLANPTGHADASVTRLCQCLQTREDNMCVAEQPYGIPHVQMVTHHVNPNFLLSVVFFAAVVYQLVLQNSMAVEWANRAWYAQLMCGFMVIVFSVISIFQHYPLHANAFVLTEYLPQQIIVFVAGIVIYMTIEESTDDLAKPMFKTTFYNGMYRVVTLPFIGLFVTLMQANTDQGTLQYVYNLLLFMSLCSLSYGLVAVQEVTHGRRSGDNMETSHLRLQQSTYLATLAAILVYSIFTIVFMPQVQDTVLGRLSILFVIILWILHLLYDAANSKHAPTEYERTFNVADGIIAFTRYALFAFVLWLCFSAR